MTTALAENKDTIVAQIQETSAIVNTDVEQLVVQVGSTTQVVQTEQGNIIVADAVSEAVLLGGMQGPPGIPGASTQFEYHVSGIALGGNRAVTINSAGQLAYPDLTTNTSFVVGISTTSAVVGELATVQITGTQTEPTWSWTPGVPVFAGASGILTQTPPVTGQVLCIGYAITPTKIIIDKQPPIFME